MSLSPSAGYRCWWRQTKPRKGLSEILYERFRGVHVSARLQAAPWCHGLQVVQLKLPGDSFDDLHFNRPHVLRVTCDERVLTQQVDDTGDAGRIQVNGLYCLEAENRLCLLCRARDAQPLLNVLGGLFLRERRSLAA